LRGVSSIEIGEIGTISVFSGIFIQQAGITLSSWVVIVIVMAKYPINADKLNGA
jgi:hypothetical protein